MIAVVAGGVGAARYLSGLLSVVDPSTVTAVVNTGDDVWMHGLRVCPDLDTCTYTLAGANDAERGWGLAGETWQAMASLRRYDEGRAWFNLGDLDIGTHLFRTGRLAEGASLSDVTAEMAAAWGLGLRLLPMTDDRVETRVTTADGEIGFQEYFVRHRHGIPVTAVRFDGIDTARPAPGVLEALEAAERVVIAPSNPIVSIGPVLAVAGVRDRLAARRDTVVAVSPIVGGAALKGPADRMLAELGHDVSAAGVARLYAEVEAAGVRCVVTDTVMSSPEVAASLAKATLA